MISILAFLSIMTLFVFQFDSVYNIMFSILLFKREFSWSSDCMFNTNSVLSVGLPNALREIGLYKGACEALRFD